MNRTFFITGLFAAGLILRILFILNSPLKLSGDEVSYYSLTEILLTKGAFLNSSGLPTAFRPPGYFLFLSLVLSLTGKSILWVKAAQAFLSMGVSGYLYGIAKKILSRETAPWVLLVSIFYMPLVWSPTRLYAETLFLFFFTAGFYYFIKLWLKLTVKDAAKMGLYFALAVLTRANSLIFLPLFLGSLFFRHFPAGISLFRSRIIKVLGAALFSFGLLIAPWIIRNYLVLGVPKFSTQLGIGLYVSYFPENGRIFSRIPREDPVIQKAYTLTTELEKNEFLIEQTVSKLKEDPRRIFKLIPLKFAFLWSPIHWELYHETVYDWSYAFLLPFFLWGIIAIYRYQRNAFVPLLVPVIGTVLFCLLFYGSGRLRFPMEPSLILIASYSLYQLLRRRSFLMNAGVLLWLSLNLYASFHYPETELFFKRGADALGLW